MKKVIAAINFLDGSKITIEHAVEVCLRTGAELEIFHAITTPSVVSVYGNNFGFYTDQEGELAKMRLDKVNEWMGSLILPKDFSWKFSTSIGLLNEQLGQLGGDLIVMGPSESIHLGQKGKVYRLVRDLNKPVLFTNKATDFNKITQVLLCLDYKDIEDWANKLETIKKLAVGFTWDVHILHVKSSLEKEVDYRNARITRQHLKDVNCFFHTVSADDISEAIEKFVQKKPSLLTIIPRKHRLFDTMLNGSVSKQLLGVDLPLLILHPS